MGKSKWKFHLNSLSHLQIGKLRSVENCPESFEAKLWKVSEGTPILLLCFLLPSLNMQKGRKSLFFNGIPRNSVWCEKYTNAFPIFCSNGLKSSPLSRNLWGWSTKVMKCSDCAKNCLVTSFLTFWRANYYLEQTIIFLRFCQRGQFKQETFSSLSNSQS